MEVLIDDEGLAEDTALEGAVICYRNIPPSDITGLWESPNLVFFLGLFASFMVDNDYARIDLSLEERKIAELFKKSDLFFEQEDFPLVELVHHETINQAVTL